MVIKSDRIMDSPVDIILGELNPEGCSHLEESLQNGKVKECKKNGKEAAAQDESNKGSKAAESESNVVLQNKSNLKIIEVPIPDFYDFYWDKADECFAVGQMWAIYDDRDGMPRFYARIKKVFSPGFKVHITWFNPDPNGQDEIDWVRENLPIACGKFVKEKTWSTEDLGMFSHKVSCEIGRNGDSFRIYPRKGETWALFKNWDIRWNSDPDNHRNYRYEFVEVLTDYTEESGIDVASLVKIRGFVSLFKPTVNSGRVSFKVPPNEILRFSHKVPSFRMTGREREDIPEGYFELDPACLPGDIEEISDPLHFRKEDVERIHAKFNSSSNSPAELSPHTPKKRKTPDEKKIVDGENTRIGNWSPQLPDWSNKKKKTEESAGCSVDKTYTGSDGLNVDANCIELSSSSPSLVDLTEIPDAEFYNFNGNKSHEKFWPGQIWALYCDLDGLPKSYGLIERVELSPHFSLEIKRLKSCDPSTGVIQWLDKKMPICCGTFTCGERADFKDTDSFSHLLTGVTTGKESKFEIYPRKGEVWALYRNFDSELSCSELNNCEYDMVEVVEDSGDKIKVLVLNKLQGFETVYKGKIKAGREFLVEISRVELLRFSHQIPAFKLTDERDGKVRGCWELDPKAVPVCLFSLETNDVSTFGIRSAFTYQADAEKVGSDAEQSSTEQSDESLKGYATKIDEPFYCPAHFEEDKKADRQKGSSPLEESIRDSSNYKAEACKRNLKEEAVEDDNSDGPKAHTEICEVPDSDFFDFDRDKSEEFFAVDQMWAIYDDLDGMPRYYARIKKVYSPGFKVQITWLEPSPEDQDEIYWSVQKLPIACGKFRHEKTENTEDLGMFSHRVDWGKGTNRGSYRIYPRKGEAWALFKNWDINWSSDPDNHKKYEYEFVEILSDYTKESGIKVAYLLKIKGFVSLFKPTINNGMASFQIPTNELLRFSHRVPFFRTTGKEREDVREGYFELDPASLPSSIEEVSDPDSEDVKVKSEYIDVKTNGSCKSPVEEKPHLPKKRKNPDEKNTLDQENSRIGSPRLINGCYKKSPSEVNVDNPVGQISRVSEQVKCQEASDAKEICSDGVNTDTGSVFEQSSSSSSLVDPTEIPDAVFYNFEGDKSHEKFKRGQIWALYCDLDTLPKFYGLIKRVEFSPYFRLEIKFLEACDPPTAGIQWLDKKMPICCGTFTCGETAEFEDTDFFSHLSMGVTSVRKNKFEIYPKKGEVWALYRNFNSEWSCSELNNCEYDMVEVVVDSGEKIKVLVLSKVQGFENVYKGKIKAGRKFFMEISRVELLRFSHQIPAFKLTDERDGTLQGCWELDPKAMPVCLFSSETQDFSTFDIGSAFTCQAYAKEMGSDRVKAIPGSVAKPSTSSPSHLKPCEFREAEFYNFDNDKTREKFQPGQIWAVYCNLDGMPKNYVQIRRVESFPDFKLYANCLNACTPPEEVIQWIDKEMPICSGTFSGGKSWVFNDTASFSHQSKGLPTGKRNKYEIHPRKGEVWALYRNCSSEWSCNDLHKCDYDMVEVLEDHVLWIVVLILRQVAGFETVFKAKRKAGRKIIIGVGRFELYRFSHQVPSFRLTEEQDVKLRGCWELDRKSIPGCLFSC